MGTSRSTVVRCKMDQDSPERMPATPTTPSTFASAGSKHVRRRRDYHQGPPRCLFRSLYRRQCHRLGPKRRRSHHVLLDGCRMRTPSNREWLQLEENETQTILCVSA